MITHNVKDWGAVGDRITDDTAAIQSAIDALLGQHPVGNTLFFPAGQYRISAPIGYTHPSGSFSGRLRITGEGTRQTRILGGGPEDFDAFVFGTTDGQYNYVRIEQMSISMVNRGLSLRGVYYSEFHDVEFNHIGRKTPSDYALYIDGGSGLLFSRCSWIHTQNECAYIRGRARFSSCNFGEDCGALVVDGTAVFDNCRFHKARDRHGPYIADFDRAAINVLPGAMAKIQGGEILRLDAGEAFANTAGAHLGVSGVVGCTVNDGAVFVRMEGGDSRSVSITDNQFRMWGGGVGTLVERRGAGGTVRFADNDLHVDPDCTLNIDDSVAMHDNTFHDGVG